MTWCGSGFAVAAVPLNGSVRKSVGSDGIGTPPSAEPEVAGTSTATAASRAAAVRRTRFIRTPTGESPAGYGLLTNFVGLARERGCLVAARWRGVEDGVGSAVDEDHRADQQARL